MLFTCRIAVILCVCAVLNNKQLHVFKKSCGSKKAFTLITIDLIEGFLNSNPAALKFYMHQRQAVYQYRHVIAVGALSLIRRVLIDHLQTIIVNIVLFEEVYIFYRTVLARQVLDVVFLNSCCLFFNALIRVGKLTCKETVPLGIGECKTIKLLQLQTEV